MRLVFDTNILIDHLRGGKVWDLLLEDIGENDELFLPTVVIMELFSGKSSQDSQVAKEIMNLISCFQSIEMNKEISKLAGEIYRDMDASLEVPDYIIAATALILKAKVVTMNKNHFVRIPGLDLYTHLLKKY